MKCRSFLNSFVFFHLIFSGKENNFELQKGLILNCYSRQMLLELAAKFLWDRHCSCWGERGTSFWWLSHPWWRISWNCTRFSTKDIKLFLPLTVTMNRCLISEEIRRALPPSLNWWVVKHSLSCKKLHESVYLFCGCAIMIHKNKWKWTSSVALFLIDWLLFFHPNIPSGGYVSFSVHWKVKNPVSKSLCEVTDELRNPAGRFSLHGSILNVEMERNVSFFSPLHPVLQLRSYSCYAYFF